MMLIATIENLSRRVFGTSLSLILDLKIDKKVVTNKGQTPLIAFTTLISGNVEDVRPTRIFIVVQCTPFLTTIVRALFVLVIQF